ncbi:MAG: hypothetical protein V1855_01830 [bacterium]
MVLKNKKMFFFYGALCVCGLPLYGSNQQLSSSNNEIVSAEDLSFQVIRSNGKQGPVQHSPVKALIVCLGKKNDQLEQFAKVVKFDLDFTDQLLVDIQRADKMLDEKNLTHLLSEKETSLCIYMEPVFEKKRRKKISQVHVFAKDTSSQANVFDKTFSCDKKKIVFDGHKVSQELLPALTGQEGIALSSLVYCKQMSSKKKVLCIADYACRKEQSIIPRFGVNVAPRWHNKAPFLFYSQFTNDRCRLMSLDLKTKRERVICSYEGLNMQPSFSPDGTQAVLCMSGRSGNSELYLYDQRLCNKLKRTVYRQITWNKGNNASPCLLPNGNVAFCSDFQGGNPQLYYHRKSDKKVFRLSDGVSYCAAPAYCPRKNALVYTRFLGDVYQLFTMTFTDRGVVEQQCTFNEGDKLDASWSPCGNYIAFTFDFKNKKTGKRIPQIGVFNCLSGKIRVLTHDKYPKSFPDWTASSFYQL